MIRYAVTVTLFALVLSFSGRAATLSASNETELQQAIADAKPSDTIQLTASFTITDQLIYNPASDVTLNGGGNLLTTQGDPVGIIIQDTTNVVWRNVNIQLDSGAYNYVVSVKGKWRSSTQRVHTVENLVFDEVNISADFKNALSLEAAGTVVIQNGRIRGQRCVVFSDLDFGSITVTKCDLQSSAKSALLAQSNSGGEGTGDLIIHDNQIESLSSNGFLFNWWAHPPNDPKNLSIQFTCNTLSTGGKPVVFYVTGDHAITETKLGKVALNGNTILKGQQGRPLFLVDYEGGDLPKKAIKVCNTDNKDPNNKKIFGTEGLGERRSIYRGSCEKICEKDTTPPEIVAEVEVDVLEAGGESFVDVGFTYSVTDDSGELLDVKVKVFADESLSRKAGPPALVDAEGKVFLRPACKSESAGRVYTIVVTAMDAAGNTGTSETDVAVASSTGITKKRSKVYSATAR